MERIGAAVVGTGFIGPVHAEGIRRNPEWAELRAIAGIDRAEAEEAARKLSVPLAVGDYRELLDRKEIDAVHICTPNFLHYPMVKDFLEAGKHVLCEKPLALTSREAEELALLAEEKGLKAAVNYNLRYYPMVQEMRQRNRKGDPREIFALQGSYLQDWLLYDSDYSWRLESKLSGRTRAVADIGTHWMDMAQYVTGLKIRAVFATFGRMHETRRKKSSGADQTFSKTAGDDGGSYESYPVDTEDFAQILLRFDGGVMGSLTVSQVSAGFKNFMEFRQTGRNSSFRWHSEEPNSVLIGRRNKPNELLMKDPSLLHPRAASLSAFPGGHQEGYGDTMKNLFRDFYEDIAGRSEAPLYPGFREGAEEMRLCEAIAASAEQGCWKEVPHG